MTSSPPAQHRSRKRDTRSHASEDTNPLESSAPPIPRRLHVERHVRVAHHVEVAAGEVEAEAGRRHLGVLQASEKGHCLHTRKALKHILVATLHAVERIGLFVITWGGVKIRVLHVVLLSRLHHRNTHHGRHDKAPDSDGEHDISVVTWHGERVRHCFLMRSRVSRAVDRCQTFYYRYLGVGAHISDKFFFEHSGLIRDWVSVYVHSAERPYFYRTPDKLCFPLEYLFVTQCIRRD